MAVGVRVTTQAASGGGAVDSNQTAQYFVAGLTERGSVTDPITVRSMRDYRALCGGRVTYGTLYDDLEVFFAEGGAVAHIARDVGAAATVGTLTLMDRAGAPVSTLRIDAENPGAWSSGVTVQVTDGLVANTFTIIVRLAGEIVETFTDLASPAAAASALAQSGYIRGTDLGSATAAPSNNPAVLAATVLSAGDDDRAAVSSATLVAALDRFVADMGPGLVAIPGQVYSAVEAGIRAHCRANRRIGAVAPAAATTVSAAAAAARALRTNAGSEHIGFFYPWVTIPDGAGGSRSVSPEGFVAGVRARTILRSGPWNAPAGEAGRSAYLSGAERDLTRAEIDTLDDDAVSAIRASDGDVRLYGWRSLSTDAEHYLFLKTRDLLNHVAFLGERALERLVHRNIDSKGRLFTEAETEVTSILEPIRAAGGLYERVEDGELIDPGYLVDTGPGVNTPQTVSDGKLNVSTAIRDSRSAKLIDLTITAVGVTANL